MAVYAQYILDILFRSPKPALKEYKSLSDTSELQTQEIILSNPKMQVKHGTVLFTGIHALNISELDF